MLLGRLYTCTHCNSWHAPVVFAIEETPLKTPLADSGMVQPFVLGWTQKMEKKVALTSHISAMFRWEQHKRMLAARELVRSFDV